MASSKPQPRKKKRNLVKLATDELADVSVAFLMEVAPSETGTTVVMTIAGDEDSDELVGTLQRRILAVVKDFMAETPGATIAAHPVSAKVM